MARPHPFTKTELLPFMSDQKKEIIKLRCIVEKQLFYVFPAGVNINILVSLIHPIKKYIYIFVYFNYNLYI